MSYVQLTGKPSPRNGEWGDRYIADSFRWRTLNDSYFIGSEVPYMKEVDYHSFHGWNTPHFHRRKNAGELLPMTPYSRFDYEGEITGAINLLQDNGTLWGPEDGVCPRVATSGYTANTYLVKPTNAQAHCMSFVSSTGVNHHALLQAAAAKAYSRGWDALTFLAEFKHVVRMFRGVLGSFLSLARRGNIYDAWLQGRYGWRVLVYDIMDVNELIVNLNKEGLNRVKERVGYRYQYVDYNTYTANFAHYHLSLTDKVEWDISYRGSVIADFAPPRFRLNPIVTGWEVITLSFVIDWFISIGTMLESFSFLTLNENYASSIGFHLTRTQSTINQTVTWENAGWTVTNYEEDWNSVMELNWREPLPIPKRPFINLNLDAFKVIDLVALVMQALARINR